MRTQPGAETARNRRCCGTQAQPDAPRQIGLVLGGGGGKGGAHLGVLAVLEELGVPIDIIVGTSVGTLGVMYAAGVSLADLERFFRQTELRRIAAADPLRAGLIGPRKREVLTVELLGERTFADLPIACAVIAANLVSGREVVLDQGPLVPALLATTAIPGVFPPVVRGDELLVDGGLLNNLPVNVARRIGAQRIIADHNSSALRRPARLRPAHRPRRGSNATDALASPSHSAQAVARCADGPGRSAPASARAGAAVAPRRSSHRHARHDAP